MSSAQNSLSFGVICKASETTSTLELVSILTHMNVSSSVLDSINMSFFSLPLSPMEKCFVNYKAPMMLSLVMEKKVCFGDTRVGISLVSCVPPKVTHPR